MRAPELATASRTFLELDSVSVRYPGGVALHEVSLEIGSGEHVAIVGPSGAGKSTLLSLIHGTVRPSFGSVRVFGSDLAHLSRRDFRRLRSNLGFVHQGLDLVPNLRVLQNVLLGRTGSWSLLASMRSFIAPKKDDVRRAYAILERVGIPNKLYERTDHLSGGQRQRVAVARALFQQPKALIADEPVSSVDPARARDTVTMLTTLAREEQIPLIVSLHNQDLAHEFFPRLVGLRDGRVIFDRASADVTQEDFRALYAMDTQRPVDQSAVS